LPSRAQWGDIDFVNKVHINIRALYPISKAGVGIVIAKYNTIFETEGILFIAICLRSVDTRSSRSDKASKSHPQRVVVAGMSTNNYSWQLMRNIGRSCKLYLQRC
jgi:hypothetical protein